MASLRDLLEQASGPTTVADTERIHQRARKLNRRRQTTTACVAVLSMGVVIVTAWALLGRDTDPSTVETVGEVPRSSAMIVEDENNNLTFVDPSTGAERFLTSVGGFEGFFGRHFNVSPTEPVLYFSMPTTSGIRFCNGPDSADDAIWSLSIADRAAAPVFVGEGRHGAVSPDGQKLAYVRRTASDDGCREYRTLVVRDLTSGAEEEWTTEAQGNGVTIAQPSWAPDSSTLAFAIGGPSDDASASWSIGVLNTSSERVGLSTLPGFDLDEGITWIGYRDNAAEFAALRDTADGDTEIIAISADTGGVRSVVGTAPGQVPRLSYAPIAQGAFIGPDHEVVLTTGSSGSRQVTVWTTGPEPATRLEASNADGATVLTTDAANFPTEQPVPAYVAVPVGRSEIRDYDHSDTRIVPANPEDAEAVGLTADEIWDRHTRGNSEYDAEGRWVGAAPVLGLTTVELVRIDAIAPTGQRPDGTWGPIFDNTLAYVVVTNDVVSTPDFPDPSLEELPADDQIRRAAKSDFVTVYDPNTGDLLGAFNVIASRATQP